MNLISRTPPQSRDELIAKRNALPLTSPRRAALNRVITMMTVAGLHEAAFERVLKAEEPGRG